MIGIDLGSNTLRCIEYDCETGVWGAEFERIVKTADRIHETGRISEAAVERIVAGLEAARSRMDFEAQKVVAVTTAAMRMASNAQSVRAAIFERAGVDFRIIDAQEEAYFTQLAVRRRLQQLGIEARHFALIDIGGGSSEVIFVSETGFESRSFPVGIVTVAQQCDTPDAVERLLDSLLAPVKAYADDYYARYGRPFTLVSTAGTPTTVAAYLQGMRYDSYDASRINGFSLSLADCRMALGELIAMDEAERADYVGVGRETLIVAGIVIVEKFYELLGFDASVVIDDGVREGVALAACESGV